MNHNPSRIEWHRQQIASLQADIVDMQEANAKAIEMITSSATTYTLSLELSVGIRKRNARIAKAQRDIVAYEIEIKSLGGDVSNS